MKWNGGRCLVLCYLAETYLLSSRAPEARQTAALALELSQAHNERGDEAWSRRILGEIGARDGGLDEAERQLCEALEPARSLGMQPAAAYCHHSRPITAAHRRSR
jgi:hypothetical protein